MMNPQVSFSGQLDYLELAGNMLERHDLKDISSPGLLEITGISQHGIATASGLNDYDYQSVSSLSLGQKQLNQIQTVNKVPIPPEILEHFKHYKCHCMMGLFPEIGRAWFTIDSEIYIWTYEQGRDVAYYDGLNHVIISVGLVTPKPNVFIPEVKYLLILTTPIEIIVLGVTFDDTTTKQISTGTISKNRPVLLQNGNYQQEMQLMSKPIFIISTDNVAISTIEGSHDGRIFFGGHDGNLYELYYQAESSWFGKRCKKVNHSQSIVSYMIPNFLKIFTEIDPIVKIAIDNSRKLLYVLTEKGSVEAWDMGTDYSSMRRISRISQNDVLYNASNIIKTVDPSIFKPIKSICPLTIDDCSGLHLLAVTQCGVRFYFSTTPLQPNIQQFQQLQQQQQQQFQQQQQCIVPYETSKSQGLYMMHVRLPPGYTPSSTVNKPKQVHTAYYSQGTLLLICSSQQDQDILWSVSSAPFPNRPYLAESITVLSLDGTVWNVAEVRDKSSSTIASNFQRIHMPKKVVLLTNQGAHIIALLKPVDILQQLLIECHGPHHEAVKGYFQAQSEREACVTCLILACSEKYRGTDVALWAAQAFMLYGGDPCLQLSHMGGQPSQRPFSHSPNTSFTDRNANQMFISTPLTNRSPGSGGLQQQHQQQQQQSFQQHQSSLMQQSSQFPFSPISGQGYTQQFPEISNIIFSARHDGLYIYVARLLRSIWKKRCIDGNFRSTIKQDDCNILLENLYALKNFLNVNSVSDVAGNFKGPNPGQQNISSTSGFGSYVVGGGNIQEQRITIDQAQIEEKKSLTALNFFIKHVCEVMSLWKILCEHQIELLVKQLTEEQRNILLACTFRDLTLSRAEICSFLIIALINSYLKDNASVSSISAKLRELCPNLYRHEDAVAYKATEILTFSKNCSVPEEKEERLRTALQLCKDAAPNLPLSNICQQFTSTGFYQGVIELTTTCAAKIDPEEFGIHYYRNNEPVDDQEGYAAFVARMNCYKEVRQMLDVIYQNVCTAANRNSITDFSRLQCSTISVPAATSSLSSSSVRQPTVETAAATAPIIDKTSSTSVEIMKIALMAIQVDDPLLHIVVYEWLLSHNMLSELLSLTEPSLAEFLRRSVLRNPDNFQLSDLLWKYYEKNGQHAAAAKILDNLSSMPTDLITLQQRIEYLARAVMCMRNDNVGYSIHNGVLLKDLEDKLEIARVQKIILDAISSIDTPEAQDAVNRLNYTLYDMTQLYSDFAEPFDLWECKLTILNCSHHNDPLLIESVWSQILNKEIQGPGTAQEKCRHLLLKVQHLVREFGDSGHCFPLAFIVRELEIKCCQLKLNPSTIPDALVGMNLDIELLIDYYARMIALNERVWSNEGNEWHIVESSTRLLNLVIQRIHQIPNRNKRRVVAKAQDLVSACLNLLYPKQGTEHQMQKDLREIQNKLQRII